MPAILHRSLSVRRIGLLLVVATLILYLSRASQSTRPYSRSRRKQYSFWGGTKIDDNFTTPRSRVTQELQDVLKWTPPNVDDRYPPYKGYTNRDYDPNRWEAFDL